MVGGATAARTGPAFARAASVARAASASTAPAAAAATRASPEVSPPAWEAVMSALTRASSGFGEAGPLSGVTAARARRAGRVVGLERKEKGESNESGGRVAHSLTFSLKELPVVHEQTDMHTHIGDSQGVGGHACLPPRGVRFEVNEGPCRGGCGVSARAMPVCVDRRASLSGGASTLLRQPGLPRI